MKRSSLTRGFTLAEVMVAGGLIIFIGYAFVQMVTTSVRGQKSAELSADFNNLYNSVVAILGPQPLCQRVFQTNSVTLNIAGTTNVNTLAVGSNVIAQLNKPDIGLRVTGMQISNLQAAGTRAITGGGTGNAYLAKFTLTGRKVVQGSKIFGADTISKTFAMTVVVNGSNVIADCFSEATAISTIDGAAMCASISGASWNGTTCTPPSATASGSAFCSLFPGASWNGTKCSIPVAGPSASSPPTIDPSQVCRDYGGYWTGRRCFEKGPVINVSCTDTLDAACTVNCPSGYSPTNSTLTPLVVWTRGGVQKTTECTYNQGYCYHLIFGSLQAGDVPSATFPQVCKCSLECTANSE